MHCYNFSCKSTQFIRFSEQQWASIRDIFRYPALSAWLEKQRIRLAIALMETYSGDLVGTHQDKGGNYPGEEWPNQLDCIDESTNTLQYLHALAERNLLLWHEVAGKKRRIVWFVSHWTALIREKANQQLYAVDSWYRDNGEPPYIQALADWQRDRSFTETLNP